MVKIVIQKGIPKLKRYIYVQYRKVFSKKQYSWDLSKKVSNDTVSDWVSDTLTCKHIKHASPFR